MIFVDGVDIGDLTDVALRDRRMLSADGIFVVVATISEQDGSSVAEPEIIFRGVPYPEDADDAARRDPRDGRRVAGARRAARRSARSTCCSRCCTTTSPRSSTSACAAGRWCCRSSSRCSAAIPAAPPSPRPSSAGERPLPSCAGASTAGMVTTKRAPPSGGVSSATSPPWESRDGADDRQAEADRAAAVALAADEAVEDALAQLGVDARAVVGDHELHVSPSRPHGRADAGARRGVLERRSGSG